MYSMLATSLNCVMLESSATTWPSHGVFFGFHNSAFKLFLIGLFWCDVPPNKNMFDSQLRHSSEALSVLTPCTTW